MEICQAYLLPSFNGPAANRWAAGGRAVGSYPDPELELKSNPNQQTAELIFVCSHFVVAGILFLFLSAQGNFMHNFRSMPGSFVLLLFLPATFFSLLSFLPAAAIGHCIF